MVPAVQRLGELEAGIDELFDLRVDLRDRLGHGQLLWKALLLTHKDINLINSAAESLMFAEGCRWRNGYLFNLSIVEGEAAHHHFILLLCFNWNGTVVVRLKDLPGKRSLFSFQHIV